MPRPCSQRVVEGDMEVPKRIKNYQVDSVVSVECNTRIVT